MQTKHVYLHKSLSKSDLKYVQIDLNCQTQSKRSQVSAKTDLARLQ